MVLKNITFNGAPLDYCSNCGRQKRGEQVCSCFLGRKAQRHDSRARSHDGRDGVIKTLESLEG